MAPLTRVRADVATLAPTELTIEYYRQRASPGGLLISEAIHISPEGTPIWTIYQAVRDSGGHVPGIWTAEQVNSWARVTAAVHAKGGTISCQLLHAGRIAQPEIGEHPLVKGTGVPLPTVSSSDRPMVVKDEVGNEYNWDRPQSQPRALEMAEIARVVEDYRVAATNAISAGFDLIEIHAAHGYLIDQFLCDSVNNRTDGYGGSIENRCRFLFEVVDAVTQAIGAERAAVRLSPTYNGGPGAGQNFFGVSATDPVAQYSAAVRGLNKYNLAYLLLTEPRIDGLANPAKKDRTRVLPVQHRRYRKIFKGRLIGAGGFTPKSAELAVSEGQYDAVAFGRWYLANPDLPHRIKHGLPLNAYKRQSFYSSGAEGYTDYPDYENARDGQNCRLIDQGSL